MSLSRPLRLFLLLLPLLGGLLLSMDWAGRQARQQALRAEGEQVRKQLDLYAGSLQTLIERFRSLPAVLALDPDLRAALAGPIDGELQQRLNLKLESINLAARSSTSDAKGIVFLANHAGWRYRELEPLDTVDRFELAETRQYDRQPLTPLRHQTLRSYGEDSRLARVESADGEKDYLWQSLDLPNDGWTLHLLRDTASIQDDVATARLAAAGTWLALVFLGLFLHQRWRIARLRQRSREELERLVEQRTADLRTAQDGLVQAAKLAALGQMSAALAHEINQPLTAQRMQLASLRLLLDAGRHDEARQALPRIDQMLERMAALTGHLKTFARKSAGGLRERIELGHVVEQAQQLLLPRIRAERVEIEQALLWPAWVMGDAIRLEQVLVNLLRNALDAVAGQERPWIRLALQRLGGDWVLSVADNGGGIPAEHLGSVFDPFFTTKPVGEGLGLGLAVSYGIVHELGGRLQVANAEAGAVFSLILPAAPDDTSVTT